MVHFLETRVPPVSAKFRWRDPEKLAAAKKEFFAMEAAGLSATQTAPGPPPTHGEEAGWFLVALRKLQETERCDSAGQLPHP